MLAPKLSKFKDEYSKIKSWDDFKKKAEILPENEKKLVVEKLNSFKDRPLILPKLTQTPSGFFMELKGKQIVVDVASGKLISGTKEFNFYQAKFEDILAWMENKAFASSGFNYNFLISEAQALEPFVVFIVTLGAATLAMLGFAMYSATSAKRCLEGVNTYKSIIQKAQVNCLNGNFDASPLKQLIENMDLNQISTSYWNSQTKDSCRYDLPDKFKYTGLSCLREEATVNDMCKNLKLLHQCLIKMKKNGSEISNIDRQTKKESAKEKENKTQYGKESKQE